MVDEWVRKKNLVTDYGQFLRSKTGRYVLAIVICIGLLALVWPSSKNGTSGPVGSISNADKGALPGNSNSTGIAAELEAILGQIEGAGQVDVSVTLASSGLKTYAVNVREENRQSEEKDQQGGTKTSVEETVTHDLAVSSGDALLVEEKNPDVIGVLVVADGARISAVREKLSNATATLLDIPVHKVTVLPRKGGGE